MPTQTSCTLVRTPHSCCHWLGLGHCGGPDGLYRLLQRTEYESLQVAEYDLTSSGHSPTFPPRVLIYILFCFLPVECPAPPGPSCFQKVNRSPVPIQKVNRSPVPIQKAFAVKGLKMEAQPKAAHPRPSKSHPAKPTNCQQQQHPRVRNYNLKD